MLRLLEAWSRLPTRLDAVDDECVSFVFIDGPFQVTIDCYDDGKIVLAVSQSRGSGPRVVVGGIEIED